MTASTIIEVLAQHRDRYFAPLAQEPADDLTQLCAQTADVAEAVDFSEGAD